MPTSASSPGLVNRVRGLLDTLYREMVKFGIVGAVAFVVDMGSFNILRHGLLSHKPTTATIVSAILGTTVAWIGNRMWTFRHRRNRPAHHEAALFVGTNALAMGIQVGIVALTHYALGFQSVQADNVAKLTGIALGTLFRFWAYRNFVFAGQVSPDTPGSRDDDALSGLDAARGGAAHPRPGSRPG